MPGLSGFYLHKRTGGRFHTRFVALPPSLQGCPVVGHAAAGCQMIGCPQMRDAAYTTSTRTVSLTT